MHVCVCVKFVPKAAQQGLRQNYEDEGLNDVLVPPHVSFTRKFSDVQEYLLTSVALPTMFEAPNPLARPHFARSC